MKTKTIHVHAWEYVNAAPCSPREIDAGGGGFNFWYASPKYESACDDAFVKGAAGALGASKHNVADFRFDVEIPIHFTTRQITKFIDADLIGYCATAKRRRVGANVLTYWRRNKFLMGGAKRPARKNYRM